MNPSNEFADILYTLGVFKEILWFGLGMNRREMEGRRQGWQKGDGFGWIENLFDF